MAANSKPKSRPSITRTKAEGEMLLLVSKERQQAMRAVFTSFEQVVARPVLAASSWPLAQQELRQRLPLGMQLIPALGYSLRGYSESDLAREAHGAVQKLTTSKRTKAPWKSVLSENAPSIRHLIGRAAIMYLQALPSLQQGAPLTEEFRAAVHALSEAAVLENIMFAALRDVVQTSEEIASGLAELALNRAARALVVVQNWVDSLEGPAFINQVRQALGEVLKQAPAGIESAALSPDGTCFRLTGPSWSPELSAFGGEATLMLQHALAPSGRPYLQGGFTSPFEAPPDWSRVPRENA